MELYKDFKPALLIINPVSGKQMVLKHLADITRTFMVGGYAPTLLVTGKRGDATEFAFKYGRDYDLVCCTGGDGTLNETITGLARADIHVPVGYIPCGSTNDFAASHNLATDIPTAALNIASAKKQRYDIGIFGKSYFTYVAAFGAFSWLSYTTDQKLKNQLGHTAYLIDGIKDVSKIKPIHMKITVDGELHEGDYIFGAVCNSLSVAGTIELPKSEVDTCDGVFEVLLVRAPKTLLDLNNIVRGLLTQDYSSPYIEFTHGSDIFVENPPELEWSLDGERSGILDKVNVHPIPGFLELQG